MTLQQQNLSPQAVKKMLDERSITLVDVREPQEYAAERIQGALLFPLSTFDPAALPPAGERPLVFHCGSGKRSATAIAKCLAAGIGHHTHMEGGIQGWKTAHLPIVGLDPASGALQGRA